MCSNLPQIVAVKCPEHPHGPSKFFYIGTIKEDLWVEVQCRFYEVTLVAIDKKLKRITIAKKVGVPHELHCHESFDMNSIDETVDIYVLAAGEMNLKDGQLRNLSVIECRPQVRPKKEYKF